MNAGERKEGRKQQSLKQSFLPVWTTYILDGSRRWARGRRVSSTAAPFSMQARGLEGVCLHHAVMPANTEQSMWQGIELPLLRASWPPHQQKLRGWVFSFKKQQTHPPTPPNKTPKLMCKLSFNNYFGQDVFFFF